MILAIRTDKAEAELYLLSGSETLDTYKWLAHRELADTLLLKIRDFISNNNVGLKDLEGLIIFTGEGSFTGLRIGTSTANSLAYGLGIAVAAGTGTDWIHGGLVNLQASKPGEYVIPRYNAEPNITEPRKS